MAAYPSTDAERYRAARIALLKGPFRVWLRSYFDGLVGEGRCAWVSDKHPTLGQGVVALGGDEALVLYERGMLRPDSGEVILFEDILEDQRPFLTDFMRGKKDMWGEKLQFRLTTPAGETVLALATAYASALYGVLNEAERRRRLAAAEP